MKLTTIVLTILMVAFLVISCGQKVDESVELLNGFIYTSYADAKAAADQSGKHMVLDFYTDW